MTKEDIIRMAREAGLHLATDVNWMPIIGLEYAEKFAALIAAHEREECAKLCEEVDGRLTHYRAPDCAVAIRARGEK